MTLDDASFIDSDQIAKAVLMYINAAILMNGDLSGISYSVAKRRSCLSDPREERSTMHHGTFHHDQSHCWNALA